MRKKGIVSVGSKFHAQYTAEALEKYNMLESLFIGKQVSKKCIHEQRVKLVRFPLYIGYILRKLPYIGHKIPYNVVSDILFDFIVTFKIRKYKDYSFVIGFNNYCLQQMKKLKKEGKIIFLEQRIAHVNTELQIYRKEFGEYPSNLSKIMINRKLKEYELADYIIVPSEFVWESMVNNGIPREKLILIPYGYNPQLFYHIEKSNKKDNGELRLLFVGQIGYRKGVKYLLEAVNNLKKQGYKLDLKLVGNVDKNFKACLNKFQNIFTHINFLPQKELLQLYNDSDVFVFPSLCEGSALVTYEALACGLPIITTKNAGSVVRDRKEGLIIKPFSTKDIENALIYMVNNPEDVKRMKQNALRTAQNYTWEAYADRLIQEIEKLI